MSNNTALIMVDVINDFFDSRGPNFYEKVREAVPPLRGLLAEARRQDALVVHAVERHRPQVHDAEQPKLPVHCLEGSFEAAFYPGFENDESRREVVVPKRRYSAFFATDLSLMLNEQNIDRIIVAGVKTNVCIRATCQDAFANGLDVVVPHEATNSNRRHLEDASLEDIGRYFGDVVRLGDAQRMLGEVK